mmetsp:Transcript_45084/g.113543  ORF Transcript_45084/g.113543 Transcript_45084/m.113543 type:complete len:262 (+) Transcript_45084:763-1548(+)
MNTRLGGQETAQRGGAYTTTLDVADNRGALGQLAGVRNEVHARIERDERDTMGAATYRTGTSQKLDVIGLGTRGLDMLDLHAAVHVEGLTIEESRHLNADQVLLLANAHHTHQGTEKFAPGVSHVTVSHDGRGHVAMQPRRVETTMRGGQLVGGHRLGATQTGRRSRLTRRGRQRHRAGRLRRKSGHRGQLLEAVAVLCSGLVLLHRMNELDRGELNVGSLIVAGRTLALVLGQRGRSREITCIGGHCEFAYVCAVFIESE